MVLLRLNPRRRRHKLADAQPMTPAATDSAATASAKAQKDNLSLAEYALSLLVLFGGWMVALFGIAGQVRPAGLTAFAITASAGLCFVLATWLIYGTNIQTLMWVADLMEDRVLRTRENWKKETLRSLVEVGSWLHITFRIYTISGSALLATVCGSAVGAFCIVLGDYFTEFAREAELQLFGGGRPDPSYPRVVLARPSAMLLAAEDGRDTIPAHLSRTNQPLAQLGAVDAAAAAAAATTTTTTTTTTSGPDDEQQTSLRAAPLAHGGPHGATLFEPLQPREELASVFATPQFFSLAIACTLAASLNHVSDGQDLGLAVILTTFANVAFITAEQVLMLWRPTRWAAVILHDRVMNVVYNWQHETIRSGFETCFYLSSIFSGYAITENVLVAVIVGTLAGMAIILISSWLGIGLQPDGEVLGAPRAMGSELERGVFMLAIFGWAVATLLYTILVHSRSSVIALGLVLPTSIALLCLAELGVSARPPLQALEPDAPTHVPRSEAPPPRLSVAQTSAAELKTKFAAFQFTLGSLLPAGAQQPAQHLTPVTLSAVESAAADVPDRRTEVRSMLAQRPSDVFTRDQVRGRQWVVIEGYFVDVSRFAALHPGGDKLLLDYAKRQADVSDQFAAFHNPAVYEQLLDLVVGRVQEQHPSEATSPTDVEVAAPPSPFTPTERERFQRATRDYRLLRSFLWQRGYFEGAENDYESARRCAHHHLVALSLGVLSVCQVSLLGHCLEEDTHMSPVRFMRLTLQCTLAALTLGFFWQQTAFIAHDALHNGVVNRTRETRPQSKWTPNNILGWIHASVCFGISSAMWLDDHSMHHAMTMRPCQDSQFNYLPVWCISLREFSTRYWADLREAAFFMPWLTRRLVAIQHYTLLPLAFLIGRYNFYITSVVYAIRNRVYYDLIGMAIFWALFGSLLSFMAASPWLQIWFTLVSHWTVGILHVQLLINHLATDSFTAAEEDALEFFAFQVRTTRNIDSTPNSDWFHGGLQFQIEHHLFPQLPRHRLGLVKPAVQDICRRHRLHYESRPFFDAVRVTLENFEAIAAEVWSGNLAI